MFYNTPIQPFDPIIRDPRNPELAYYWRNNFTGSGQDSFTQPPAQDESMWIKCLNVMPPTQGVFNRRWGLNTFSTAFRDTSVRNFYSFQRDSDGLRLIIGTGDVGIQAYTETGALTSYSFFVPSQLCRMLYSRNYAYFISGNGADLNKWTAPNQASGWGIDIAHTNANVQIALGGGAAANQGSAGDPWVNPDNALANDGTYATSGVPPNGGFTTSLVITDFGFSIPSNAILQSIVVEITGHVDTTVGSVDQIYNTVLVNSTYPNGFGLPEGISFQVNQPDATHGVLYSIVGWEPNDINGSGFGVLIDGQNPSAGTATYSIDYVSIIVTYLGSTTAPVVTSTPSGDVNLTIGRIYYYCYQNSTTGHLSDLSDASGSTGSLVNQEVVLGNLLDSADPQVDSKVLLATSDGGDPSSLYYVDTIVTGTTTYTDDTQEADLVLNQIYQFTDSNDNDFGVAENLPPPSSADNAIKHQGRIWLSDGQNIYFSKAESELTLPDGFIAGKYEESFPAENYFDISEGAETISGLNSDGQTLYIGTQSHIRRILGSDPTNFQLPAIVHPQVGLLSQETWQIIYLQGAPSGCIWMTPDFKIMGSDFTNYTDIGHPIQDILNTISLTPDSRPYIRSTFVQNQEFNLYIIGFNTHGGQAGAQASQLDTYCIYDVKTNQWYVWQHAVSTVYGNGLFFDINATGQPLWLLMLDDGKLYQFQSGMSGTDYYVDGFVSYNIFPVKLTTSWMAMGAPSKRKILNKIAVNTNAMTTEDDVPLTVTIYGANSQADFGDPVTVGANIPFQIGLLKEFECYLASLPTKYLFYQFQFSTASNIGFVPSRMVLGSYKIDYKELVSP